MGGIKFNPDNDIPDLTGKVVFITGGTAGLGRESILALATHFPAHIFFSGRNSTSGNALTATLKASHPNVPVTYLEMDLASLSSIAACAKAFLATFPSAPPRLDVLMCNAGIMCVPPALSADGFEIQFATNHLGHALLVKLLLPTLLATAALDPKPDVRIVILTSAGYRGHPSGGIVFADLRTPQSSFPVAGAVVRYGQSKLANILYAAELARRYPAITSVAIHPGVVTTGLVGNQGWMYKALIYATSVGRMKEPKEGCWNQLWAAVGKGVVSGEWYMPVGVRGGGDRECKSEKLAGELWEWTEEAVKEFEG